MLTKITYPDSTQSDPTDNPFTTYNYSTTYPYNLLSIVNENGIEIAAWTYDPSNRALTSTHANSVDNTTLDYTYINDPTDPRIKVTNSLNKDTIYHYTTINGKRLVTQVEGIASANCVASNRSYTYDANGNYDRVTDWEGSASDFDFDLTRNLEIQRIEAVGTAEKRKIVTQWHSIFRLPIQLDTYDSNNVNVKRIAYTYDANGNLTNRAETYLINN